ncbi:hypothetical protein EDB19DRAFT_1834550 [Suillus lakei]|nr:hypothetical protein EDB19DRAFT_1834550 [Suillus lakei]
MPAVVAHHDANSYPPSLAINPWRRYASSSSPSAVNAIAVQAESRSKASTKKLIAPSIPMGGASSQGPSFKTPAALEEGIARVQLAEIAPDTIATVPLSDDAEHKLPQDDPTNNTTATPGSKRKEFPGVGAREFYRIQYIVGETEEVLRKPRLTYNYITHVLTIDMASTLHEEPFDYLKERLTIAIDALPYDPDVIRPRIHMNRHLQLEDQSVTPDMTIALTSVDGPTEVVSISALGECALSEDRDHVFNKMETEIKAHPEADLAVIVLIREAISYASPLKDSTVSKALRNGDGGDPPLPIPLKSFITQRSTPRSFAHPVTVADHQWCQVQSVEYFVWVKGEDGSPIDIRQDEPGHASYGALVPEPNMEEVTELLNVGMSRIRDSMVKLSKEISPGLDCSELEEAEATLKMRWSLASKGILSAMDVTAHERYETWYTGAFRGNKHNRDSTYVPPQNDSKEESHDSDIPRRKSKRLKARG